MPGKVKLSHGPVLTSAINVRLVTAEGGGVARDTCADQLITGSVIILINYSSLLQDDNFSLSLLNELSVKYGIQTHLSHAPLPQKLEELREYLRREIKKELKVTELFVFMLF